MDAGAFLFGVLKMAMLAETGISMNQIPFEKLKGEEKQYRIEDAARTLKRYAELKRKDNSALLKAARDYLKQEIADSQKVLKSTS